MPRQEVTFEFPDPDKDDKIEVQKPEGRVAPTDKSKEPDNELDIEVVDDVPEKDRNKKAAPAPDEVTDTELEGYSEKVKKRIQHFTRSYHDERRAKEQALREREELERLAAGLLEETKALKAAAGKNQTALVTQAKQAAQLELDAAKAEYRKAYEAGDTEKVIEAQELWTKAQLKLDRVNNFRPAPLQDQTTDVKNERNTQSPSPAPTRAPDAKAVKWAQENPWFGSDDEMTAYALGVHNKLVKAGVHPNSDEYYEKLDSRMRHTFSENFSDEVADGGSDGDDRAPAPKPKATVAAASRGTAPRKVRLTQTQVQLAKRLGVPLEEYAKSVAALMRNS